MTFFQNSNSVKAMIPPLTTDGFDSLDSITTSWSDFLTNPVHSERRQAFKEFVFLMFYHRNRRLSGAKFPHNVIFEKVLKFFVETLPNPSGFPIPSTISSSVEVPIFQETSSGSDVYNPISSLSTAQQTPILRGENNPSLIPDIQREIDIALATNNSTVGFFQETATLFAHFYLFRQLTIINGHKFRFTGSLGTGSASIDNAVSGVILRYQDDDNYQILGSSVVNDRTNRIMIQVDKSTVNLPYFYNSLIATLKELGFQVPNTPLSTTSTPTNPLPSYVTIDHQKIFLAYFIKLLDPTKTVGIKNDASGNSNLDLPLPTSFHNGIPTSSNRNAIINKPRQSSQSSLPAGNNFIEDLFTTIRSGNVGPDLGGAGSTGTNFQNLTNVEKRPFFINATTLPFSSPPTTGEILNIIQKVYNNFSEVTQQAILTESRSMMGYFLNRKDNNSINTILASGVGQQSVSILGIKNFGLPYFNYKMERDTSLSMTNSVVNQVSLRKRNIIHIGVYALDLFVGQIGRPSKLTIRVENSVERYSFELVPEKDKTGDIKIIPDQFPFSPSAEFYSIENTVTGITSYYRKLSRKIGAGSKMNELVAEYHEDSRDLKFRSFTKNEMDNIYDFSLTYPSAPTKNIEFKVKSAVTSSTRITEELLTLSSVFEDNIPNIISDDVLYESDTFQLFGSFANNLNLNKSSFENLLEDSNSQLGIKLLFDLIEDPNFSVNFLPPILKGSFIGKIPETNTFLGARSSKVVPDNGFEPKFSPGSEQTNGIPSGKEAEYQALKFSWVNISFSQSPAFPAIPNSINVQIEIVSFVNPSISSLDSNVNQDNVTLLNSKIDSATTHPYNQVLAMLRSFGLLEGIVEKLKEFSTNHSASTLILAKLNEWLPANGSPEADDIICVDEDIAGTVIKASDINLNEYYLLKN